MRETAIKPVWSGLYTTWEEACTAANTLGGNGQSGEEWFDRITYQLIDYRKEISQYGVAMPPRATNLPQHCSLTRPTSILDLGGSSGWCWDHLINSGVGEHVSSYYIVETQEVVDYMTAKALQSAPVLYQTLEEPLAPVDTLYCNSVLQYFESNEVFISVIEHTCPEFILLDDLVAVDHKDFFTVQLFRGSAIPYRFLELQSLLNSLTGLGYRMVLRCPYPSPIRGLIAPLPMENFPAKNRLRYSSSLLLKRENTK
jgi:putative methyltransferase (TIGR04325 family)